MDSNYNSINQMEAQTSNRNSPEATSPPPPPLTGSSKKKRTNSLMMAETNGEAMSSGMNKCDNEFQVESLDQLGVVSADLFSRHQKKKKFSPSRRKLEAVTEKDKPVTELLENLTFSNILPSRLLELASETIIEWLQKLLLLLLYFPSNIMNETSLNNINRNVISLKDVFHFSKDEVTSVDCNSNTSIRYMYVL